MAVLIAFVLAFVSFLTVGQAAEPSCEELIKPLVLENNYTSVLKKWIFVEGVADNLLFTNILKTLNSSWIEFTPTPFEDTYTLSQGNMLNGVCEFPVVNSTMKDSRINVTEKGVISVASFVPSCVDCLTLTFESEVNDTTIRSIYLFVRKQRPSESDMDVFWKQAECLGISKEPQFSYDGVTEFCQREQEKSI